MEINNFLTELNKYVADEDMPTVARLVGEYNEAFLDILDPKCLKCDARKSAVEAGRRSYGVPILCKRIGKNEWMGYEHHQFKPNSEIYGKRINDRKTRKS